MLNIIRAAAILFALGAPASIAAETKAEAPKGCEWRMTDPAYEPNHYIVCLDKAGAMAPVDYFEGVDAWSNGFDIDTIPKARAGNPRAMAALGDFYAKSTIPQRDLKMAFKWYMKSANAGDPRGMTCVSYMYAQGWGVTADKAAAKAWLEKAEAAAIAQNDTYAMVGVGFMYQRDLVGPRDEPEMMRWFVMAAEKGSGLAMFQLGARHSIWFDRNDLESKKWFDAAAETSEAKWVSSAADSYRGGQNFPKDPVVAARLYKKAAELGYVYAAYALAQMYAGGEGVARDPAAAAHWYTFAAQKGDDDAMERLAQMYADGVGVAKDDALAAQWREKTAARRKELPPPVMVMVPVTKKN